MDSKNDSPNLPRLSFWRPLAFMVIILATLVAGKVLMGQLREAFKQEAQGNISAVGELRADQIQDLLEDRASDVRTLSDDSFFSRAATLWMRGGAHDDANRRLLVEHLSAFLETHQFRAIVLYDVAGRALLNVGSRIPDARAIGVEARGVAASRQPKFIDLHRHQDASLPVGMGYLNPLQSGTDVDGVVYLVEDPAQYLFPLLHEWPSDKETAETHLVRAEGDQVRYLNRLRHRSEQSLGFALPLSTPKLTEAVALRGKLGLLEDTVDYRGKAVLSYAVPIQGTPWVLISTIDEDEVYRTAVQVQRAATMAALIVFGAIAAWFWHWQRRQRIAAETIIRNERGRVETLLQQGEKRFRTVFEHTALPMVRSSPEGEFIEVNDAWCAMFGYSREEVASQHLTWQKLTYAEDVEPGTALARQVLTGAIEDFKTERRYISKAGKMLWGSVQASLVRDDKGEPEYFICAIHDITERKQAEQQISFMAYHDKLTGLPNRALLFDRLAQAMSQAKRDEKSVALLFVDLDGFKSVNDQYGHEAGDAVLRMAAQRFLACVRAVDTVSRFGGDEFAIVLGGLDGPQRARGVAEKIVHAFAQGMTLSDGNECHVGASIGISIYPEHGSAMDNLLTAADHAMYESKHRGKNTYTFFKEEASSVQDSAWVKLDGAHLLGVQEFDEQHRNLAYLVNRLNEALKHDEPAESVSLMFDELLAATVHHFDTESQYMTNYHFPEQDRHEAEHAQLVNEAQHFKAQFTEGRELLALQSIKDWLLGHIAYSDKSLASYLKQHGVK